MSTAPSPRRPDRRELLKGVAGALAAPAVLGSATAGSPSGSADPLAPKPTHFPGTAKRVIWLFMPGGVSHVDSFDYKPKLIEDDGKDWGGGRHLVKPFWPFRQRAECGAWVSDLFPHVGDCADRIAFIRSMRGLHGNHYEGTLGIHTGSTSFAKPGVGAWVSHAMGTENPRLPSHMVIAPHLPYAGALPWSADFLPACHQGVRIKPGSAPLPNLSRRSGTRRLQELELSFLDRLNRRHGEERQEDGELAARARSFETAVALQEEGPKVFDLTGESDETHEAYGLKRGKTRSFAWQCLVARRLSERGVRFVELIDRGSGNNWDSHGNMDGHRKLAADIDRPIAALLRDLAERDLLDETLVVWTTEFGRPPHCKEDEGGRGHHARAFTCWMAGGGVRGGLSYGETDEHGDSIVKDEVTVHDLHATVLHLLGFDHERLTHRHSGRDFRLTDVHGSVVRGLLARA